MKNDSIYYSVGALLYCPANKKSLANSIIQEKFGTHFSLALCLEDTIPDSLVFEAEQTLLDSLRKIYQARQEKAFFLPAIFLRIRNSEQLLRLYHDLGSCRELVCGFILPKFSTDNSTAYLESIQKVNANSAKKVYMMPIYENSSMIDLRTRYEFLYQLKEELDAVGDLVLNIRVGGNDLCHMFGFRRHSDESIHRIAPVAQIFSDIISVYGMDYVVSGPVWEYFSGDNWKAGMLEEIRDDRLCGFLGKTVIHPNQIDVVNRAYMVSATDYKDAKDILNWSPDAESGVSKSAQSGRMNEHKTHTQWARQTLYLAEAYGVEG